MYSKNVIRLVYWKHCVCGFLPLGCYIIEHNYVRVANCYRQCYFYSDDPSSPNKRFVCLAKNVTFTEKGIFTCCELMLAILVIALELVIISAEIPAVAEK